MGFLVFIGAIYIAYKLVTEEWGMGDFHRDSARRYEQMGNKDAAKYERKQAGDSDLAVGCSMIFLVIVGMIVIGAWLGTL